MTTDINVTINLEIREAIARLRDLRDKKDKAEDAAQNKIWGSLGSRMRNALGAVMGNASASASARSRVGPIDPWAASILPFQAQAQQFIDREIGYSAKARRTARTDTVRRFAHNAATTQSTAASAEYFRTANFFAQQEEAGRQIARQALQGPTFAKLLEASVKGWTKLLGQSFSYLYDRLTG